MDDIEIGKLVAETRAKDVKQYDSGRIALLFAPEQQFSISRAIGEYDIVRVKGDTNGEQERNIAVYLSIDE